LPSVIIVVVLLAVVAKGVLSGQSD
jgi:hypothetical protein